MTWISKDNFTAEVGKTYKVTWDDCCTSGWFISKLVSFTFDEDTVETLVFEHGEVTDGFAVLEAVDPP